MSKFHPVTGLFILYSWHIAGAAAQTPAPVNTTADSQDYVLGAGDQVSIFALGMEDIPQKPLRIGNAGTLTVPLAGTIQAAGLTVPQLEAAITERLHAVQRQPQVTVTITEYQSQPISIIGAVKTPGVHQLAGKRSLIEVLSLAGGLTNDAGYSIKISRQQKWGPLPLPNAAEEAGHSTAEVNVRQLMEVKNPALNIAVRPNDIISVPRARTIFVIGEVSKSGGYILGEDEHISVLQALSMAGGLTHIASPQNARILRSVRPSQPRVEQPVDLKKILSGRASDVAMNADDILFIPNNKPKTVALRAIEAAVSTGSGVVMWRASR